uniref:Uncharacterized protein n=1 Tax=Cacopsylla melanoneura TaxID=428564 RepID=A0A8D9AC38_9HEMI
MPDTVSNNLECSFFESLQHFLGSSLNFSRCFFKMCFLYFLKGFLFATGKYSNMGILENRICSSNLVKIFSENFSTSVFNLILISSVSDIGRVLVSFDTSIF